MLKDPDDNRRLVTSGSILGRLVTDDVRRNRAISSLASTYKKLDALSGTR
jgi:hypothetical protein